MMIRNRVKEARMEKGLTQDELAEKIGVTRQTIGQIEAGRFNPSINLSIDLAKTLDKTLDYLFWLDEKISLLANLDHILITDIGSTTTKALLLKNEDGAFRFIDDAEFPTTVEKPVEDVKIGLLNAIRLLEKKTKVQLLKQNNKLVVPYITTSSAGGGLQLLVFGLTSTETGTLAKDAAYGAGGVVLNTFTIDDRISDAHKMHLIRELHPDLVIMAGGTDNGNIDGIIRLAEILSLANPLPKFKQAEKIPLVFCGNTEARRFVRKTLENNFVVQVEENIRPSLTTTNLKPTVERVHKLFMENVMERAPGYSTLKNWVETDILPTPTSVGKILELYDKKYHENILMVDIGGATTDIFSNISGEYHRTVAANMGMSYSLSNVLKDAGLKNIMKHLPQISEKEVRDYIYNKVLEPNYIPTQEIERRIEQAAALEGAKLAWKQHLEMNFKIQKIGLLDKLKSDTTLDPFEKVFLSNNDKYFQLNHINLIIGAGGVFAHAATIHEIILILTEGLCPSGITRLAVDKTFKSPHMGILSQLDKDIALQLFENECLKDVAYVIAPTGVMNPKKKILTLLDRSNDETIEIKGGEIRYFPKGGSFKITAWDNVRIENQKAMFDFVTDLALLIDCRGRNDNFNDRPLIEYGLKEFALNERSFKICPRISKAEIFQGEYKIARDLPYEGEIFLKEGEAVLPQTQIGVNKFPPPRLYIIDIQRMIGYENPLKEDEIKEGLLVKVGDKIKNGQKIFVKKASGFSLEQPLKSPVRGLITKIEKTGWIILREIQDYTLDPVKVKVTEALQQPPKYIGSCITQRIGDFIEQGQVVAKDIDRGIFIKAPASGTLKEINSQDGTITIQYDINPVYLKSFIKGYVSRVFPNHGVEVAGNCQIIQGSIGFGKEGSGELQILDSGEIPQEKYREKVVVSARQIDGVFLREAEKHGLAGIIAPSIRGSEWISYYGKEMSMATTGDENIPFTLVLTEGFGDLEMEPEIRDHFSKAVGKLVSLSSRTQIRTGVMRPKIIIND